MTNFAVINDGKVSNIIVADTKQIAEEITGQLCVEYTEDNPAHIGLSWDGTHFEQLPAPEQPTPVINQFVNPEDEVPDLSQLIR